MKRIWLIAIALGLSTAGTGAAFADGAGRCDRPCTSPASTVQLAAAMPPAAAVMLDAAAEAVGKRWLITVQAEEVWHATRGIILMVQRTLTDMGYDPGPIDGAMGPSTRRAIRAYQQDSEVEETGKVTEALVAALEKDLNGESGENGDGEAAEQQAAEPALEPEIEITDDPASYDLGDLSDLNSFD